MILISFERGWYESLKFRFLGDLDFLEREAIQTGAGEIRGVKGSGAREQCR